MDSNRYKQLYFFVEKHIFMKIFLMKVEIETIYNCKYLKKQSF